MDSALGDEARIVRQLFDGDHYLGQLDGVVDDPLAHYLRFGWTVGVDPHPIFSSRFYLARNPDVAAAGVCPLVHYVRHGSAEGRQPHPLFDVDYYQSQGPGVIHDPLSHYLRLGWTAGLDPHPVFSTRFYLDSNPDVSAAGICPLVHYARHGAVEDRQPHPLFNPRFYRELSPPLGPSVDPLVHFLLVGGQQRRNPSEWFDTDFYLSTRPDVAAAGANALVHYATSGWRERSDPHPDFDVSHYLATNPDVRERRLEPLAHYLSSARAEGRASPRAVAATPYPATIVIPLLRQRDDWLERSVRSALVQTVRSEVIVVTSPATPRSNLAVLSRLRDGYDNLVVHPQARPGFAAAINTGIVEATASRVGILLSDDWIEPDTVAACLGSTADVVSTARRCYAEDGVRELVHLRRPTNLAGFRARPTLEQKADYLTHFFLIHREKLLEVGGLDESLGDSPGVDDYDLIWVLLEHEATVDVVERFAYNYRDHGGDRLTLRNPDEMQRTLEDILGKHGIIGYERDLMVAQKSVWLGRPLDVVAARLGVGPDERTAPAVTAEVTLGVCVLFFERPDQTIECLESLGDGGPQVYVWNNGSSPSARATVGRYARDRANVILVDSPVNLGVAAGRNRLIDQAREDLLLFLDSDITVKTPEWATLLRDRANEWPDVEVLIPVLFDVQENRVDDTGRCVIQGDRFVHAPAPEDGMNFFPGGAACVRRTLFDRLGGYDESIFVGLEDYELAIRALRRGQPICARSVPELLLHHDRRRAQTDADARAAQTRYSLAHVQESYERVLDKHGVRYDADWRAWLEQQRDRVVGTDRTSSLG